jgi:excisionase family DNA binding protein
MVTIPDSGPTGEGHHPKTRSQEGFPTNMTVLADAAPDVPPRPPVPRPDGTSPIRGAVRAVSAVQMEPDFVRVIIHWLKRYGDLVQQRYGTEPAGLSDAITALGTAYLASRQRDGAGFAISESIASDCETSWLGTDAAAELLGVKADTVRKYVRCGHLVARKVGRQHMVSAESVQRMRDKIQEKW